MKSLEILEDIKVYLMRYIDDLETTLSDLRNNGIDSYSINYVKDEIALTMNTFMECKTIKSDLEVLEILRKHYKDIKVRPRLSNMKDLQKLKQWLEENENE